MVVNSLPFPLFSSFYISPPFIQVINTLHLVLNYYEIFECEAQCKHEVLAHVYYNYSSRQNSISRGHI